MARPLRLRARSEARAGELLAQCEAIRRKAIIGIEPDEPEDVQELQRALSRFRRTARRLASSTPRNAPCPCGSGSKYKNCCGRSRSIGASPRKKARKYAGSALPPSRGVPMATRCGLCGKTSKLVRTECCGQWICDDEDQYELFSYARNSCLRNHRRFTLCGSHNTEGHDGHWKDCSQCREDIETELYVYFGTNEYNFDKLEDPPKYEPTRCEDCGGIIRLGEDAYTMSGGEYSCERCRPVAF